MRALHPLAGEHNRKVRRRREKLQAAVEESRAAGNSLAERLRRIELSERDLVHLLKVASRELGLELPADAEGVGLSTNDGWFTGQAGVVLLLQSGEFAPVPRDEPVPLLRLGKAGKSVNRGGRGEAQREKA